MSAAVFTVIAGALFGFGLALSGMIRPEVVLAFLQWQDFGLMLVMAGGLALTLVAYQFAPRWRRTPLLAAAYEAHTARMQRDTFVGAALFGVGWGLSGVCPGPAIAGLGAGNLDMLWSLAGLAAGAWLQGVFAAPAGEADWQEG
ncbi:MAG: YeeE/YedE family protein [Piscinibacter sp.]|uniref:DUF6691 family protein n=1 Tax=Piscinibacter sp. TaxID=1903157 RepID=UPI001B7260BC|nr:DUF6691 family protein [Piscinibacter sp.]MBP5991326.1 YeeE/YedE family protein [Piscinibacter sp.]MBP6028524.1 YeeE/YedE family protein [Piscinibacter sp.]